MIIRFDDALKNVLEYVRAERKDGGQLRSCGDIVVVRDVYGRLRLAITDAPPSGLETIETSLKEAAGRFFAPGLLVKSELVAPDSIFGQNIADVRTMDGVRVLERTIIGADWTRPPLVNVEPSPPRATLYGMKGGVGRSTALIAWSWYLAQKNKKVLVIDLDLESPGVSSTLLPDESLPDLGVADWLVEDAVDNAGEELLRDMVGYSPIEKKAGGRVLVVPCLGRLTADSGTYVDKLARCYLDIPGKDGRPRAFAERIASLIDLLESEHKPDVVLIDSRAGLHDIAGVATTRLDAMTFLFAVNSRQTWSDYRALLKHWKSWPQIAEEVRERIKIVAALVPETGRESYLKALMQNAYDVFSDTLYDEEKEGQESPFNFDVQAEEAPHSPLKIYWGREFQDWDPLRDEVTAGQIDAAFGEFLKGATELLGLE